LAFSAARLAQFQTIPNEVTHFAR